MNMEFVNADCFVAIKNRTEELQQIIHDKTTMISTAGANHEELKRLSLKRKMYKSEFYLLFPNPPVDEDFVTENNKIAALQAEIDEINTSNSSWSADVVTLPKRNEIKNLEAGKAVQIKNYHNIGKKGRPGPGHSLTEEQFLRLYPEPVLTTELALIASLRTEIGQLHNFLQSGTWPKAGLHDVDLLAGTAISYPL